MFDNSIEPTEIRQQETRRKEIPIREATRAETRRHKPHMAPHAGETDAVAKRHNLYTADKWTKRIYYADYQQKSEVMRAASTRITTKLDDRQTVSAMLDLAQSRGWQSINLRGTDTFRREAWVQATVRGMDTVGYQPKQTDLQEVQRRKAAAAPVTKAGQAESSQKTQVSAEKPATTKADQTEQKRQTTVWGSVETTGKQARQNDTATATPTQKPTQKPAAAAA